MSSDITFLFTFILILHIQCILSQFVENQLCDSKCLCLHDDKMISCDKSNNIAGIPTNIEPSFHRLIIQYGNFKDSFIYRKNLTGLNHLTYLKVIYCKLNGVEPRAFENMKQLKYLDLSHNNIRIIQPFTFIGLHLGELHLMENRDLNLLPDSFKGMYVDSINLRSNDIKSIDFDTFDGINLQKLYLYNNKISVVDHKFSTIFNDNGMLIDLTGNPLDCTCEMKWLLEFLQSKFKDPRYYNHMKTVNFTCKMPSALAGKEMIRLSVHDLLCDLPKIKSISITFGIPITQLTCTAIGNNNRSPGIAWNYIEDDNVRELRRNPVTKLSTKQEKLMASLSVNVSTVHNTVKAFTCSTWLENNYNEKIVVNIKSPPKDIYKTVTPTLNQINKNDSTKVITNDNTPLSDSYFIFQKQFTVLEMIGAIVGTFIITLILLLVFARIMRWWKKSRKRELNYKTVNIIKPYWTMGHDSNTYSVNYTEYDLPKIYDSRHSSICQSPPESRIEYLDYKTLNKIYSS